MSLSYGKDSIACLGAIEQLGLPLDRIIHAEIWATKDIPADLPPMVEFKAKADKIIKERYGITVEHVSAGVTYEDVFYRIIKSGGKSISSGHIYGFPALKGPWCNSRLKVAALKKIDKNAVSYIGIAYDEPKRFKVLSDKKVSPLVKAEWTEEMCREWCVKNNLLSPIYSTATRGGCWFCHNQGVDSLRQLRRNYPNLWSLMLKWDADSVISFKPNFRTIHDFEKRFEMEDEELISTDPRKFRWRDVYEFRAMEQLSIFSQEG